MDEADLEKYLLALRTQLAERRALWDILQELIGQYALAFDDPIAAIKNLSERVTFRLDRKETEAKVKGLELSLATEKTAVDRFFSDLTARATRQDL